jgi:hypothetical protein
MTPNNRRPIHFAGLSAGGWQNVAMKFDRKKKISTCKERQQHASRRAARARKNADSIAQMAADDMRGESHLVDKLKRKTRLLGNTSPPRY